MTANPEKSDNSIWWFAFGYFAAYVPYSALTKYLSKFEGVSGFELLPITAAASLVGMLIFITAMGWWKHANHRTILGVRVPMPTKWTFLSGLCTAAIIPTTTLAYTFGGISIVFMMLLMRGGVLIIAPIVDFISRRKVRWYSWAALGLTLTSLVSASLLAGTGSYKITLVAVLDLVVYLAAYFIRLQFMSRMAKSDDENARTRYFVEEQMTATPMLILTLALFGWLGSGPGADSTARGFTEFFNHGPAIVGLALLIGILSQGTGVFGGLILLDKRENSYCVPVNRASSILAGLGASYALWLFLRDSHGVKPPAVNELVGAGLIIAAILVLSLPPALAKMRASKARVAQPVPLPIADAGASAVSGEVVLRVGGEAAERKAN